MTVQMIQFLPRELSLDESDIPRMLSPHKDTPCHIHVSLVCPRCSNERSQLHLTMCFHPFLRTKNQSCRHSHFILYCNIYICRYLCIHILQIFIHLHIQIHIQRHKYIDMLYIYIMYLCICICIYFYTYIYMWIYIYIYISVPMNHIFM